MPYNVMDCFPIGNSIPYKMTIASLEVQLIREDIAHAGGVIFSNEINVLWSTKETYKSTNKLLEKFHYKPIHISTEDVADAMNIATLTVECFKEKLRKNLIDLQSSCSDPRLSGFLGRALSEKYNKDVTEKTPFVPLGHNCTAPLVQTLVSAGYEFNEVDKIEPSDQITQHINGMKSLINLIDSVRKKHEIPMPLIKNDAIVFCPSMYAHLYKTSNILWKEINRKLNRTGRNLLNKTLIRHRGYGNITINADKDPGNPYDLEIVGYLIHQRQKELSLFTDIISIIARSQFCPAIRLPSAVMLHHDILHTIYTLIISTNANGVTNLNRKLIEYSNLIKEDLGADLIKLLFSSRNKLFCVCDFPIEWISINGIPIMFTHEISRVSATPGNLTAQIGLAGAVLHIRQEALFDILIIRSFGASDPIRKHIEDALQFLKPVEYCKDLNIRVVDVSNQEELIEAINSFSGVITIFDCHGNHGGTNDFGWLKIGDEKVDVWQLSSKCHISPIVILSACSTHPINGSHASVANGFLKCGALSVLGTYAPIGTEHAAQFVTRLLLRIAGFIPLLTKKRPITWRETVSGFLKMSYSTDILRGFCYDLKLLAEEKYQEVHTKSNAIINSGNHEWIDNFIALLAKETGLNSLEIRAHIQEKFQFVNTMLYSQLGRPENILIYGNDEELDLSEAPFTATQDK